MKINEMKRETKRRIYALALASIMFALPKTKAFADDVDMSSKVDIDKAISELIPDDTPSVKPDPKPADPVKPTDPVTPTNPSNPTEATDPSEETKATEPTNGTNNSKQNDSNSECPKGGKHVYNEVADGIRTIDGEDNKPSCTNDVTWYDVYFCEKCGYRHEEKRTKKAEGHEWDSGTKEGNKIVYHCKHKGCNETTEKTYDPTEPTKSTEPTNPSSTPTKPTEPGNVPKTGDNSIVEDVIRVALLSSAVGTALVGSTIYQFKKEEEQKKAANSYKGKYLSKR